jgi:hypothetical protein
VGLYLHASICRHGVHIGYSTFRFTIVFALLMLQPLCYIHQYRIYLDVTPPLPVTTICLTLMHVGVAIIHICDSDVFCAWRLS